MIQEQLRKRKRYTYTHMYTFLQSMYICTFHHGGGGGGWGGNDLTSDIEKQGRSKSYGLQKVMVVAKYM